MDADMPMVVAIAAYIEPRPGVDTGVPAMKQLAVALGANTHVLP